MKINWKKVFGCVIAVVVLAGIIGGNIYQQREQKTDKPVVKIGVTLPLTGPLGYSGRELQEAMKMRIEEVPANSKYIYKINFQDDQLKSSQEFSNVMKFVNVDKSDVVVSGFAGSGEAIADLTRQNKVIHFDSTWSNKVSPKSPYTFVYYTPIADIVETWLKIAHQKGYRKISVINNDSHLGGEYAIAQLKQQIKKYPDMEIIDIERVPLGGSDLRTVIYKMSLKNPDVYVSLLLMPSLDRWMSELRSYENKVPVSGIVVLEETDDASLFNGSWFVGVTRPTLQMVQRFEKKYNHKLRSSYSAFGYGLINRVIEAYEAHDTKPGADEIAAYLSNINDIDPVVGPVTVDQDGQFHLIPTVFNIQDGKIIPIKQIEEKQ